jgi:hypothetical protein
MSLYSLGCRYYLACRSRFDVDNGPRPNSERAGPLLYTAYAGWADASPFCFTGSYPKSLTYTLKLRCELGSLVFGNNAESLKFKYVVNNGLLRSADDQGSGT